MARGPLDSFVASADEKSISLFQQFTRGDLPPGILYVPFVFLPKKWRVLELPNPMGEATGNRFSVVGRGLVRMKFERQ